MLDVGLYTYIFWIGAVLTVLGGTETITFLSLEHPHIEYYNPRYFSYANITSRRLSRSDPRYYMDFHFFVTAPMTNNMTIDLYFYEFLSNSYRRGFVEVHFKMCDFLQKEHFFIDMKSINVASCPIPPGELHFVNLTAPWGRMPVNFPFTKGRIVVNITSTDNHDAVGAGHIDMELKTVSSKNNKRKSKYIYL